MPITRSSIAKRGTLLGVAAALAGAFIWHTAAPQGSPPSAATGGPGPVVSGSAKPVPAPRQLVSAAPVTAASESAQRRVDALEARLAEEMSRRVEMQQRIDALAEEIAALRNGAPPADDTDAAAAKGPNQGVDYSKSPMQRALEAAGLDTAIAEGIKLRGDQLAMSEMYLRDQATREGWVDTPRFKEEMEEIEAQRVSVREEIGDDAYDRYLFALGHTNRVIVNDVMLDSVAEDVGLREGDLIVSYGDARIFAPDDLITSTQGGASGEPVVLEVRRNGERMQIEVPRGPLGLRIGPAQDDPDAG